MGITRSGARLLLREAQRRRFSGSVIQLGKMFVFFSERELRRWARRDRLFLPDIGAQGSLSHDPVLAAHGCMDDTTFFKLLGFDEVRSLDGAGWEGADIICDLNEPILEDLNGKFDMVFEGGTMGSIFHTPELMANIHRLLRPGGRVIHAMTPSHNNVDLGFYMMSPTFFYDYYSSNGWRLETLYLCEYFSFWKAGKLETGPWNIYSYEPGVIDHLNFGRFGNKQLTFFVVATKTEQSTADRIPQQSYYRKLWDADHSERQRELEKRASRVKSRRKWYGSELYSLYCRGTELFRRNFLPRRMPTRLDRV